MLLIAIVVLGVLVGGLAQLLLGTRMADIHWPTAVACGLVGSLLAGVLLSLLFGEGLQLRPAGLIGSVAGALVVTLLWSRRSAR